VLTAAAATGVRRVVLCTSAMVYGALADNELPLPEDAPLRAVPDGGLLSDWLEVERLAAQAPRSHRGLQVTVLRPATVVGPGVDSLLTRHFEAPRLLVVRDSTQRWQFCHVDDLAAALELAALGTVTGSRHGGLRGLAGPGRGRAGLRAAADRAAGVAGLRHRRAAAPAGSDPGSRERPAVRRAPVGGALDPVHEAGWRPAYDNVTASGCCSSRPGAPRARARRVGRRDADHRRGRCGRGRHRHRRAGRAARRKRRS
jgi:nucleoside-diphosphate-sugar epimerase